MPGKRTEENVLVMVFPEPTSPVESHIHVSVVNYIEACPEPPVVFAEEKSDVAEIFKRFFPEFQYLT